MSEAGEHLELLKNAVRQPIAALTAVETDTVYQAKELAKMLAAELGERPNETLSMAVKAGAASLLYQARRISENWADDQGVLFVIDDGGKDADKRYPFWVEMNGLRESWAALNCHVIFFLLPGNYRMLLQVADHLADWIPVKLRIMSEAEETAVEEALLDDSIYSEKTARQQLSMLEKQLVEALNKGTDEDVLIRRYYLPMFDSVMKLRDLSRAQILKTKISETSISEGDLPIWFYMNFRLDYELKQISGAEEWAKRLLEWGERTGHPKWKARAFHAFGRIAQKQQCFNIAEEWHKLSIEIRKEIGDISGLAVSYHNLGNIALEQRIFELAEKWYRKALEIRDENKDEFGIASSYYRLGLIAVEQKKFEIAETYYRKSLELSEKLGVGHATASNYIELAGIAKEQHNFESARVLYLKALGVSEKTGYEHVSIRIYRNLGLLARLQERLESSGEWLIKSIKAFENTNDPENAAKAKEEFQKTYAQASPDVQAKLKEMWAAAGLSEP